MLKKIYKLYKYFVMAITVAVMVIVNINVFYRYVLNHSLGWASELSRYIFIWVTFLGAALAYDKNEHVGLSFIINMLPEKIRPIVELIGDILILIVLGVLFKTGITVFNVTNNTSPALGLRLGNVYSVVPFSMLVMIAINLGKIKQRINNILKNFRSDNKDKKING
ncbi:TRAP transporter small permease [Halanaerobacter jeridensis]|uniref:TRAP-type C4-dicarboxylate transport system permease small subunit n=1 Tax=Halanaerobacter jeridensis TaxID=706427 RepID=A0A938XSF8_9FIRM|nr:TRAP transporter small permease [Halanaerobacter jeridensis]MBM7556861.1 TRAP-type C4-dicarboxylate transport system permease small subunit [Halanaerobacter jeridensis]